jgi:hypothetical protein
LPEEFYFPFESASAKALYYVAEEDPKFLEHLWLYPNEAEGVDLLVEILRPLLSGGSARHVTVNKDASGRNVGQEFTVEGPVSVTIPTIRNKLDNQLQSRMLIADLKDYEGRVAAHSRAVSEQLSPGYVAAEHDDDILPWRQALRASPPCAGWCSLWRTSASALTPTRCPTGRGSGRTCSGLCAPTPGSSSATGR